MMTVEKLQKLQRLAVIEPPVVQVALDGLRSKKRIRKLLQTEFEKGLRAKKGVNDLIDRIQKVTRFEADRAKRIALTERTRAQNGSRYSQAIQEYLDAYNNAKKYHRKRPDLPCFQWVHTNAAKEPRHSHIAISGDVRPVGSEFLPNLRYPGDPQAPASEVINCRCYIRRYRK